ncbi:MAG: exo-alpha-sialidase [Planctomycetaceae bacterium]|nr:exo-alpha-sialidase [Planctomycetaceae bacterium]
MTRFISLAVAASLLLPVATRAETPPQPGIVLTEFLYDKAPFPECHASTIAETKAGLVAAWFGGTGERNPDVGIWLSRNDGRAWSAPVEVANGVESPEKNTQKRYPCWNPVLFNLPANAAAMGSEAKPPVLLLFYKVGPSPSTWWGMLTKSLDEGQTWSKPQRLPDNFAGPIKNKPILLAGGKLLCPSSTEDNGWRIHMEWTGDAGSSWTRTDPLCDGKTKQAIQPTLFVHGERLQALCRNRERTHIWETWSSDGGITWSELEPVSLPHPGSGIDGVTLKDGRHLLVYNHTTRGRSPLNVALSTDGKAWQAALVLESEPGEYSYPAVIQTADDNVHITYTWKRQKVKHVVVDPAKLAAKPIVDGKWPE